MVSQSHLWIPALRCSVVGKGRFRLRYRASPEANPLPRSLQHQGRSVLSAEPIAHTSDDFYPTTLIERLGMLRSSMKIEADAIMRAAEQLSPDAVRAAEWLAEANGSVIVTGVGKAGLVGQKLVATLASTGTPAHFVHPSEAVHGDLGRIQPDDLVVALSSSGKSEEVVRIASYLRQHSSGLIALTAGHDNPLAEASDCVVSVGVHPEACPNGLAPTSSTAVLMAVGDAMAMLASRLRSFSAQDFSRFHPGGALGRKLALVDQFMRPLESCRLASVESTVREAMVSAAQSTRRSGAVMLINEKGGLVGLFTDSDLARLLADRNDKALDEPIESKMTLEPVTIQRGMLLNEAVAIMSHRKISELPVVDASGSPVGLLDITDLVGLGEYAGSENTSFDARERRCSSVRPPLRLKAEDA